MQTSEIHCTGPKSAFVLPTRLLLARFGQVCDTCVRTHEDVARVQAAVKEGLLGVRDVDATQRCFRERVGRDQGQTIQAHLVDAVNGLKPESNVRASKYIFIHKTLVTSQTSKNALAIYLQNVT